jgi:hypothetical protein
LKTIESLQKRREKKKEIKRIRAKIEETKIINLD